MVVSKLSLPIIQSLWIGDDLTQIEKLCVQSFLDHGHEFHLYTYSDIGGIPQGAVIKDGNEILPTSQIFPSKSGSYAQFADWFRYAMLVKNGGFWVDMDVICIKPFDFDSDIVLAGGSHGYTNAIIGMPENHTLMISLERTCRNYRDKERASWGAMGGPAVLTRFIRKFEMEQYAKPFMYFYPWSFNDWHFAFDQTFSEGIELYPNTFAIHLYNEMGRKIKLDKNAQFDSDSLIEKLKTKHHIAPISNAKRITSTNIQDAISQNHLQKAVKRKKRQKKTRYTIMGAVVFAVATAFFLGQLW